jgi:import inner membrane translocase subunit TIM22
MADSSSAPSGPSFYNAGAPEAASAPGAPSATLPAKKYEEFVFHNYMDLQRQWALNPPPEDPMRVSESCASKAALSTAIGGAMGVVVGVVFGTMGTSQPGALLLPGVPEPPRKAWRHEIRDSLRQTRFKARSWAKNFAFISGTYSGVECVVEKIRGKKDVLNSVGAGCITGAGLAVGSGPQVSQRRLYRGATLVVWRRTARGGVRDGGGGGGGSGGGVLCCSRRIRWCRPARRHAARTTRLHARSHTHTHTHTRTHAHAHTTHTPTPHTHMQAMCLGCAGFAAFSLAIDMFMGH